VAQHLLHHAEIDLFAHKVLLAGKTYFRFPAPGVAGPAIFHRFFEVRQLGAAQVTQARQRLLPFSGCFLYISGYIFGCALHCYLMSLRGRCAALPDEAILCNEMV